jgi:hypothetical protein
MSSLAVFLLLGGGAALAAKTVLPKKSVGSKQLKTNAVTAAKIKNEAVGGAKLKKDAVTGDKVKDGSLTGADINLSTLGTVPNAANAANATNANHAKSADNATNAANATNATNAANAANAANASNVATVRTFSAGAEDNELVSLVKTANFELMGICDPNGDFDPPGVQFENTGTAFVIYNRSTVPAFADTEDDEDADLTLNQGVVFNYDDNGDGGEAMSIDGHFLSAPSWANLQADINDVNNPEAGDDYPFPTACHFAGSALVG